MIDNNSAQDYTGANRQPKVLDNERLGAYADIAFNEHARTPPKGVTPGIQSLC